jgi:hypothetical protein
MSSLQVAYALLRRAVCGSPRLRLASAAGPLVNNYELDCLPLSSTPQRWQPSIRTRIPFPSTTTSTTTTTTLPQNTTWQGQVVAPQGHHYLPYTTRTLHAHDVLVTTSSPSGGVVVGKEEPLNDQIKCIRLPSSHDDKETYRLDPVTIDYFATVMNVPSPPSPPPVPIWADSVHHRPGL